jgi:hypothetical protein
MEPFLLSKNHNGINNELEPKNEKPIPKKSPRPISSSHHFIAYFHVSFP